MDRYLNFNTKTAENPVSHKYNVANGINIRKALLATSGYSSLMLFQTPKSDNEENFICSKQSDEISITSSAVVKFDDGFSANRLIFGNYCTK